MGSDHLNAQLQERRVQGVSILGTIADHSVGEVMDEAGVKRGRDKGNLMRRSRGGTRGERKTSAVCHCHELRTFAPLGLSHASAPFFATTKVPSMKHSERSSLPRSFRSRASASKIRSYVPSRTQRWNRRWQVWYGGYWSRRSAHWAPVRKMLPNRRGRPLRSASKPCVRLVASHGSSILWSSVESRLVAELLTATQATRDHMVDLNVIFLPKVQATPPTFSLLFLKQFSKCRLC